MGFKRRRDELEDYTLEPHSALRPKTSRTLISKRESPDLLFATGNWYKESKIIEKANSYNICVTDAVPHSPPGSKASTNAHYQTPPPNILPLTKTNLSLLENTMPEPGLPATPASSRRSGATTSGSTSSNLHKTNEVRRIMAYNNIIIDDFDTNNETKSPVLAAARDIVNGTRGSEMRQESRETLRDVRQEESTSNEMSFLVHFWRVLIKEKRNIFDAVAAEERARDSREGASEVSPGVQDQLIDSEPARMVQIGTSFISVEPLNTWAERKWDKDFIKAKWCADLKSSAVPRLCPISGAQGDQALLAAVLKNHPRIATPRPDIIYGLRRSAFTPAERLVNETFQDWASASEDCFHPFFLVECKLFKIEDAENQIARGGSSLVNARRNFDAQDRERAMRQNSLGPDLASIAFSLALTPAQAHLFIHWVEVIPSSLSPASSPPFQTEPDYTVVYHTTILTVYRLTSPAHVLSVLTSPSNEHSFDRLRHDLNNILDWGTLKRKKEVKEVCEALGSGLRGEKRGREAEGEAEVG